MVFHFFTILHPWAGVSTNFSTDKTASPAIQRREALSSLGFMTFAL
jgi:hypothetical protein